MTRRVSLYRLDEAGRGTPHITVFLCRRAAMAFCAPGTPTCVQPGGPVKAWAHRSLVASSAATMITNTGIVLYVFFMDQPDSGTASFPRLPGQQGALNPASAARELCVRTPASIDAEGSVLQPDAASKSP